MESSSGQTITINPGEGVYFQPGVGATVGSAQAVVDAIRAKALDSNATPAERAAAQALANMLQAASSQEFIDMVNEAVRNYRQQQGDAGSTAPPPRENPAIK